MFDFSSAEVKILANLCKDPSMMKAVADGLDFHSNSASLMLGIPYKEYVEILRDKGHPDYKRLKNFRQIAKVLTFSILYGSSASGISFQLGVTKEEAEGYIKMYFSAYPGMKAFIDKAHAQAKLNQLVVTPFGQRRWEYGAYDCFKKTAAYNAALRNSSNILVQSPTSTLGLLTFAELNRSGMKPLGGLATCTVYDSCEWTIPLHNAAAAVEAGFKYMDDWPPTVFDWLELPIGVECEVGTSWGNAEVVHRGVTQGEIEKLIASKMA